MNLLVKIGRVSPTRSGVFLRTGLGLVIKPLAVALFRPVAVQTMDCWYFGWWDRRDPFAVARMVLWRCAQKLGYDGPVVTSWHQGLRFTHHLTSDLSLSTYVGGRFEPNEMSFVASVLEPGMTAVDAGANDGLFSLLAARLCGEAGMVHALEPSARERRRLERNVHLNHLENIRIHPMALGKSSGTATLQVAGADHPGHNTLGAYAHAATKSAYEEVVPLTSLDQLVASEGIGRLDLLKMDIEGSEGDALRGAQAPLRVLRPRLLMELQQQSLQALGSSVEEVLSLLAHADYVVHSFTSDGRLQPFNGKHDLGTNVVALPSELSP